jgi:arylsulfatase A-like enzyme
VMTGQWPHASGCKSNNIPLPADVPCIPEILDDSDYRTAYMGKWHLGDEIYPQHGFQEWVSIEDGYSRYYSAGRNPDDRSDYHHFLVEHGCQPAAGGRFSRGYAARRPLEQCKPKFLETRACDFLRARQQDPFILSVNFLEPHMPFYGPLDHEHDPAEVQLPDNYADPLEANEPLRSRVMREHYRRQYPTPEKMRDLIRKYWGLVTQVDLSVGRILETLEDLGLADNTVVVYTSDHGDMMGSHNMVGKTVMYEESAKVPWLMRIPHMENKQKVVRRPVSQIDLVPTVLDAMGSPMDERFPGKSLLPGLEGNSHDDDHVFIEWNSCGDGFRKLKDIDFATEDEIARASRAEIRVVVSPDGWKLCLSDHDRCQLFNLREDPGETVNLFDSGRHGDIIGRLTGQIHKWQESVDDKVVV